MANAPLSSCSISAPRPAAEDRPPSLETLPNELIQLIVGYLARSTLKNVALVCHTLNRHAVDILWQNVCLSDQRTRHVDEQADQSLEERNRGELDEHDDTPILQKLYILATNPAIASRVQVLTHRCHLSPPNIFTELPRMYFYSENMSRDRRLHVLLKLAVQNMVNVQTLRIVFGHWKLTNALLVYFLDQDRPRCVPLRKLWLESCCLSVHVIHLLGSSSATGLESIRIRRLETLSLDAVEARGMGFTDLQLTRGGVMYQMHNGSGGWVKTTVQSADESVTDLLDKGAALDTLMWNQLPEIRDYVDSNSISTSYVELGRHPAYSQPVDCLLDCSLSTLTSLNLDWILWRRNESDPYDNSVESLRYLQQLRFPHLRAFQLRNAVLPLTKLPPGVFLLEDTFLEFMEAHPKLQCLGWPLDRIYGHTKPSINVQNRSRKLVAHLATMLTDLRIDTQYAGHGEPLTDESRTTEEVHDRIHRIRFITEFAPHMRKIEQIKIEGGIPRDEKRELLRALHWCPLKKIVMIGVSFPAGNTWGFQGFQLKALDPGQGSDFVYNLEEEDLAGILASYRRGFSLPSNFTYTPSFGWPSGEAPLLQTVALHHARTVEELKICGYNGCPILSSQTPITNPLLNGLRHYDNLKQLVISLWLLTWYEDSYRDGEIIQSWLDTRSPASTALVVVTPPTAPNRDHPVDPGQFPNFNTIRIGPPVEFNRWAVALKTRFSPSALAYRVARDIGPYLSPVAKEKPGGVRVRASFCLGVKEEGRSANDIFDLDICVGKDDQVLEFIGPREEGEKGRWWSKLEARLWF